MRNELIIPDSAVEMTYSDMCEVNGGYLWSQESVDLFCIGIIGTVISSGLSVGTIVGMVYCASAMISAVLGAIPVVGLILEIGIKAYIATCAWDFAEAIVTSIIHRQGIEISAKLKWGFIPMIGFTGIY